jgi:hypothetical protein
MGSNIKYELRWSLAHIKCALFFLLYMFIQFLAYIPPDSRFNIDKVCTVLYLDVYLKSADALRGTYVHIYMPSHIFTSGCA